MATAAFIAVCASLSVLIVVAAAVSPTSVVVFPAFVNLSPAAIVTLSAVVVSLLSLNQPAVVIVWPAGDVPFAPTYV